MLVRKERPEVHGVRCACSLTCFIFFCGSFAAAIACWVSFVSRSCSLNSSPRSCSAAFFCSSCRLQVIAPRRERKRPPGASGPGAGFQRQKPRRRAGGAAHGDGAEPDILTSCPSSCASSASSVSLFSCTWPTPSSAVDASSSSCACSRSLAATWAHATIGSICSFISSSSLSCTAPSYSSLAARAYSSNSGILCCAFSVFSSIAWMLTCVSRGERW